MVGMKRLMVGVAAGAMTLSLAACGSDDPASSASPTGPLEKCDGTAIKFQLSFFPNAQYAPLMIAESEGYFEDAGVDVELVPGGPNVSAAAQIGQGLTDMALIEFGETQNANLAGADLVWIAQFYQKSPVLFAALKETPLSEPADLEGLTTNTFSGDLDPELHGLMDQAGLSEDDVEIIPASPSISDLINDTVDVYAMQTFFHVSEIASLDLAFPDDFNILDPNELGAAVAPHGIVVRREFLNENPDAVACMLAGVIRGADEVVADPAAAVPIVDEMQEDGLATTEANKINVEETAELLVTRPDGSTVEPLEIDNDFLATSQETLVKYGILPEAPELDSFVDTAPLDRAAEFVADQ